MATQQLTASPLANPFNFQCTDIRCAVDAQGNPWFCAKDVCAALGLSWAGSRLQGIPDEWKLMSRDDMNRGGEGLVMLSEPALYRLIFRSNKPKALEFTNWVCAEVLPALRRQGFYGQISPAGRLAYSRQITALVARIADNQDAFVHQGLAAELRDLCNAIGRPMPDVALIGQPRQMALGLSS